MISESEMSEDKMPQDKSLGVSSPSMAGAEPDALSDLLRTTTDPTLNEDMAQALLKRPDLPAQVLELLAKNATALKSRKVKVALVSHPRTPRHVSVPLARQFYTFDLMKVSLSPSAPPDLKVAIEDLLISRLKTVTIGERLTLARRSSGRVAAALLLEGANENANVNRNVVDARAVALATRVMQTALENSRLTEALVIKSVLHPAANASLIHTVAHHPKWSNRREIRAALLRTEHLSLARALEFGSEIPAKSLHELLTSSSLPAKIKDQLLSQIT